MKRGSADYDQRRESYGDTQTGGAFSGWFSKTFRGLQGQEPANAAQGRGQATQQQEKSGDTEVMSRLW